MKKEMFDDIDNDGFSDEAELVQLVGLKLGDEEYAIDVLKIQEIIRSVEITVVPRMDNYILGVMNLRGKVIPVIDLRIRFSLEKSDFDKSTRIIVVRFEKQNIGFVVDEVTEVIRIKRSMVEPTPPLVGSIGQEYILGICRYDARLIMLLDIDRVINESGEQLESELRKKMLGSTVKTATYKEVTSQALAKTPKIQDEPAISYSQEEIGLPNPSSIPSPLVSISNEMEEMDGAEDGNADEGVAGDIDALIAKELEKREAETDQLNKKKRDKETPEDVLKDAIKQSAAIFTKQDTASHVEQNDLDALIAQELAKREVETDELNKKNREDKKKNTNVDFSFDVDNSGGTPAREFSQSEKSDIASVSEVVREGGAKSALSETAQRISVQELKSIVEKIIAGETPPELDMDIKGEIGELLRLVIDTKTKVDDIDPLLEASRSTLPNVTSMLEDVNKYTEKATINLMDASNDMSSFYKDFIKDISDLKNTASQPKEADFHKLYDKICGNLSKAEDLGFKVLEALEFQDITEQKLRKVIHSIEDMGGRIGAIVGYLQVKGGHGGGDKQIEKLLSDYGLA